MPSLKVFTGKEICKILSLNGFNLNRQKGSHIVMQKNIKNTTITVIVPNHKDLKKGTLLSIIRQSQLERSLFEKK